MAIPGGPKLITVSEPSTAEPLSTLERHSRSEIDKAISLAQAAFDKKVTTNERLNWLKKLSELIIENANTLEAIIVAESGKLLYEAREEVDDAIDLVMRYIEQAEFEGHFVVSKVAEDLALGLEGGMGIVPVMAPWQRPLVPVGGLYMNARIYGPKQNIQLIN